MTTTIVIPCYNEEERLPVDTFLDFTGSHDDVFFVFVNDGSTDKTGSIINSLRDSASRKISVIHLEKNVGKAEAVRAGMLKTLEKMPDYLGFWDADLSTPLWEIPRLTSFLRLNSQIKVVLGARVQLLGKTIIRKTHRHYIGRFFATVFSNLLKIQVYDTQCGSKIFRFNDMLYQIFTDPFLTRWLFDVEILARLIKHSESQARPEVFIREEPLLEWRHVGGSKIGVGNVFQIMAETCKLWNNYREK